MKKKAASFFAAIIISTSSLADIYQWVDENGNTQYSDRQPENQDFKKKNHQSPSPSIDPELEHYRQQIKVNEIARKRAQALAKEQQKEAQKKAKQKKRYCNNLKSRQHTDNNTTTFYTRQPDGSRAVWTGEKRKQYTKSLKDKLDKYCR